ncbi:hypothetical protein G3I24_29685 [Micromonospora aurantiaca]|nr:hypothetical protein [Micromonospora aurantiaca]
MIAQQTGLLVTTIPNLGMDAAQAAWSARWRRWPLITADPDVYEAVPGVRVEQIP